MDDIEDVEVDVNHPSAGTISAIDKKSVHRICSGQVVLTLATAVKELLENSIDAGATIIDIKLKDYGSEQIEVSDNGNGVHQNNFEGLTLKHHTSKLQEFSDLINVETFGFRGEALSSLCALSDMCVSTRHKDAAVGTKLEFDHNGKLLKQSKQARQVGTTVTLQNLFYTLPVRHKEFQRNLKKEFVKMVQVLNSYCIISTGVRITCSNQTGKGSRSTVVSSKGNANMLENISNVFGPKQPQSLLEFKKYDPNEDQCSEFGIKKDNTSLFSIEGYVSKCDHGQGRSSTDRQFFFINGRPFDSAKLSKVINEVYHQYNRHQYPFVVFKISVQKDNVDVNVTPDKRQVFLEGEKVIMATVKTSLITMYEPTTSILQYQMPAKLTCGKAAQPTTASNFTRLSKHASLEKPTGLTSLMKLKRSFSSAFSKDNTDVDTKKTSPTKSGSQVKQRRLDSFVSSYQSPVKTSNDGSNDSNKEIKDSDNDVIIINDLKEQNDTVKDSVIIVEHRSSSNTVNKFEDTSVCKQDMIWDEPGKQIDETGDNNNTGNDVKNKECKNSGTFKNELSLIVNDNMKIDNESTKLEASVISSRLGIAHVDRENCVHKPTKCVQNTTSNVCSSTECVHDDMQCVQNNTTCVQKEVNKDGELMTDSERTVSEAASDKGDLNVQENKVDKRSDVKIVQHQDDLRCKENESDVGIGVAIIPHETGQTLGENDEVVDVTGEIHLDMEEDVDRKESCISFSMDILKNRWQSRDKVDESSKFSRAFRATINPAENLAAEQELQREIKKDMFSKMEILGQFNKGFIITRLEKDLFIVDQHATDEKFNFETLQRDTVIQSQKLIAPLNLELTSSNETILMDNIDIFRKNGFEFIIDEEGPPTQRVKLMSTPVSKNWNFGKEDIEEMIFMLTDSPGVTCRPSRVRAMFASRACRKSIMIGTRLNKAEMKKLVCHMGEIEQPWNCPHGRPTMRHLINLDMVPK
ncbi:mismatch repair endonuclease PMS2-like [Ruditapes philippinarum]|uniref:mismatch repair endonuclease PMS2-like n=1 Tax=Ruditapes philippinarum TaxID=129788 RepID=UPI00295AE5C8|nr:mismatch repair endonuclease PMS2-like [Ruditapes philippinarum]XP_060559609.1 mismatch repair endonuclease PMS2-like [Ruditapes philippinarum]